MRVKECTVRCPSIFYFFLLGCVSPVGWQSCLSCARWRNCSVLYEVIIIFPRRVEEAREKRWPSLGWTQSLGWLPRSCPSLMISLRRWSSTRTWVSAHTRWTSSELTFHGTACLGLWISTLLIFPLVLFCDNSKPIPLLSLLVQFLLGVESIQSVALESNRVIKLSLLLVWWNFQVEHFESHLISGFVIGTTQTVISKWWFWIRHCIVKGWRPFLSPEWKRSSQGLSIPLTFRSLHISLELFPPLASIVHASSWVSLFSLSYCNQMWCICCFPRFRYPKVKKEELKEIVTQFIKDQDYERAYIRIRSTDWYSSYFGAKSNRSRNLFKEHVSVTISLLPCSYFTRRLCLGSLWLSCTVSVCSCTGTSACSTQTRASPSSPATGTPWRATSGPSWSRPRCGRRTKTSTFSSAASPSWPRRRRSSWSTLGRTTSRSCTRCGRTALSCGSGLLRSSTTTAGRVARSVQCSESQTRPPLLDYGQGDESRIYSESKGDCGAKGEILTSSVFLQTVYFCNWQFLLLKEYTFKQYTFTIDNFCCWKSILSNSILLQLTISSAQTVPPDHLFLDSAPNLGPLISRWEINNFENCRYKSVRILAVLKLFF